MNSLRKIIGKIRDGYLMEMYAEMKWMYRYAKRYWKSICFYMITGVIGTGMGLGTSLVSKHLIDAVTGVQKSRIGILAALIVVTALCSVAANAIISRISAKISIEVQNEIQSDIYHKVIYTDWEELHQFRSGDLLNRLTSDASQVASSIMGWLPNLVVKITQFLCAFILIFYYDPVMAFIALLGAPLTFLISWRVMIKMRIYNKEMRALTSDLMSFQNDSFQNLQTLKAFGLMSLFGEKLEEMQHNYEDKMMEYTRFQVYTSSIMSLAGMSVTYICFGWSVYRLWSGYITTGTMLMFIQMANSLISSFRSLMQVVPAAINAATCAGRLMSISELEKEKVVDEKAVKALKKQKMKGITVNLRNIDVIYKEGNQVIEKGNFLAKKGEITAIIGSSGEGKTTLIRIFLGLIYPVSGTAQLLGSNGVCCNISSATRCFFGYVPQGNTVFSGTIAENMRMVKCDATDEEIIEALKQGCAWEFVEQMPQGIHSFIGEHGTGLSEGQAQRLAIARAILTDAPVLLLDEATSALDMETEERVLHNIVSGSGKRTCIVTTHRPSVLSMSDHIYKIQDNQLEKVK